MIFYFISNRPQKKCNIRFTQYFISLYRVTAIYCTNNIASKKSYVLQLQYLLSVLLSIASIACKNIVSENIERTSLFLLENWMFIFNIFLYAYFVMFFINNCLFFFKSLFFAWLYHGNINKI